MEGMPLVVAVTLSLGNSISDSCNIKTQVEIAQIKLVTDTANMLPVKSDPAQDLNNEFNSLTIRTTKSLSKSEVDELLSVGCETNAITDGELLALNVGTEISLSASLEIVNVGDGLIVAKAIILEDSIIEQAPNRELLDVDMSDGSAMKAPAVILQLPHEKVVGGGIRSVFEFDCVPLWGTVSICGRRPEMEDTIASIPRLMKIPIKMLIGDRVIDGLSQSLTHQTTHFFGVYDGHGGSQVADYCRDRIHMALVEEMDNIENSLVNGLIGEDWQSKWEKSFTSCFQKVDDEIGGKGSRGIVKKGSGGISDGSFEPIASETVGSTAVVALICSSHIIVANCGDSRAVLCRGKEAMALSVDHKPNREDEYARIEAAGGKVIQWDGYRVLGILAMSRSIGDRHLKPWIIPEPEVKFIPRAREDECLIIASDGLWDVMSNEEACEVARKRILLWHRKNGTTALLDRGKEIDPAAQAAAEYLSMLAMQKGSKDNISVIVVDLKAQRKNKTKPK